MSMTYQKVSFGDLPTDGQEMLTRHLAIDFSHTVMKAPRWFCAWAQNSAGNITGIFAAEFCVWFDAKITVLILDPHCCTRRVLRAIFTALFSQAKRLTAEVEPGNLRSLNIVQRLGFFQEGYRPLGLEGARDTILFGMVKDECPWLGKVFPRSSRSNVRNRVLMDIVDEREVFPRLRTGANGSNLFLGQGSVNVGLADISTFDQIGHAGFPADVLGTDAARHSAGMRGVHFARRQAVYGNANEPMNLSGGVIGLVPHLRVAPLVDGERPQQAVVSGVGNSVSEKIFRGHHQSLQKV